MPKDFTFEEATEPKEFSFEDAAPEPEPTYPPTYSPRELGPESPTGREESLSPLTFAEWWKATPVRREMEQKFGAGGVPTPKELVDTAFKFASVPPQVAEPYKKITDAYYSALPPAIGGTAAGLRDVALEFPIAAGAVGMGKTMGRLVMGLFTGEYAIAIPEMWQAFKTAKEQGRTREAYQIATKAIAGGLLLGAGGAMEVAGMRGGKVPPVIAKPEAPKPSVIPEVPPETAALLPKAAAEVAKPEQPAAPAAQPETPDASGIKKATEVHGDVRPLAKPASTLPVKEGGERVQPQTTGGLPKPEEAARPAQSTVLLKPDYEQKPIPAELQTPEDFTANEVQKLALSDLGNLDERSPSSFSFDISGWTRSSKAEAQGISGAFAYSPEGTDKFILEFPAGTRPRDAISSLVEAIKQGDGPGSGWLPTAQEDAIRAALKSGKPVLAESLDQHGIRPPRGYIKTGGIYRRMAGEEQGKKAVTTPKDKTGIVTPQGQVLLTPVETIAGEPFFGESHDAAFQKALVKFKGDKEKTAGAIRVHSDQLEHKFERSDTGQIGTRQEAIPWFKEITGKDVSDPKVGLDSSDVRNAGILGPKATSPPAGPGEGVPSKTTAASAALPVTSESGGVAAPPEAARQPPASTVSVKGQEKPLGAGASIASKEEALGHLVRDKILNAPSFPKLLAAAKSFQKSIYKTIRPDWEESVKASPWDLLSEHAGVMNAKSARAKTLRSLADAVIREAGLPMEKPGAYRGMQYRIDWDEVQKQSPLPPPAPGPGMGEGPGALTAGTPPTGKAQIEQLADAFKNKAPAGQRVAQLMRGSFDYGTRIAQAKDAVSRAISGLKSSGDALWTSLTKFEKPDELLQAKGQLSAELETRGWRVRQFANDVKRAIPDVRRRAAISKWIDSGGDQATLQAGMSATKPEYRQAYADAMNLRGDDLIAAQNISNYFEARLQEAIDAGVLEHGLDDYIHRIYEKDPGLVQRASAYVQSGILSKNPSLAKKRLFQFDWEAEAAGKRPVQDFLPRVTDYETSLARAIAAREFIAKLSTMTASDGRPIIGIKGVGIPVEDPAGVRTGTLIQPKGDFKKAQDPTDLANYREDYEDRTYPSLKKWKWVGKDAADQDIFLQGDVAIHKDYAKRIDRLLAPSAVRKSPVGSAALGLGSTVKQTMLDFSLFHHVQIGVHAMEHRVMPWSIIKDIDFENPKVEGLLKGGVTLGGEYRGASLGEGLVGRSISRHIPGLGPVMESYHEWLFQSFIPRVKMTMALHALERNRARYAKDLASGRMTETDLNFLTAKQANAAFGELNYITMERSKTFQDMARLVLLAPDFLEARAKFAAQAFTKYGREQRVALFLGAAALYTAARVFNKLLDDQYHFEPENLFNVVYKNNAYSLRTVQGDLLHLYDKPFQFWLSRLNPVYARTLLEGAYQRDYYGRKRTVLQMAGDAVSTVVPISMRSSRERHLWESFLNGVGITARRWNDVQAAYKLASEWKTKNHIREAPGEFVYDADKDPLRPLKIALSEGDEPGSVKEIGRVLASKALTLQQMNQYFQRYSRAPFTGSMGNDRKWYASLSKDHQQTVDAARQHRQAMWTLYSRARGQYFQSLSPTPLTP